jgi:hypothetical protein
MAAWYDNFLVLNLGGDYNSNYVELSKQRPWLLRRPIQGASEPQSTADFPSLDLML